MQIQELNVYLVLFNNNRILLMKRPDGIWEFPGGGVDWGENPEDSAIRELREETGITVQKPLKYVGITSAVYKKGENDKHAVYIVYSMETQTDRVTISSEHVEHRWLNKTEIGFLNLGLKLGLNAEPVLDMLQL